MFFRHLRIKKRCWLLTAVLLSCPVQRMHQMKIPIWLPISGLVSDLADRQRKIE